VTESPDRSTPAPEAGSFLGNLFNLYFEPAETFAKIFARPRVFPPILLQTLLGVAFISIWLGKVDTREFMRLQMEQNPRVQQMPAEQVQRIIDAQANFMKTWARVGPLVAPALLDLVLAGIFLFIFRFFMAADVSFPQSLATVAWTFAALGLVQTPILLTVFSLKGDWNLDPNQVVQANPTLFFEQEDMPRWLWSLCSSIDLFSLWTVFLLATGYSVASRRGLSSSLWAVGIPWLLYVMAKVTFRAIFG
jgi:hypothetical protein